MKTFIAKLAEKYNSHKWEYKLIGLIAIFNAMLLTAFRLNGSI